MHILLTVAYDGTAYAGYQRQKNGYTVQEALENALAALYRQTIPTTQASRTDAGVHALGQRVGFFCDNRIPLEKLPLALNALLPPDIAVSRAEEVPAGFHPRFDALEKTYRYQFALGRTPDPLMTRYALFVSQALDVEAMGRACEAFAGEHDFAAFCAAGGSAKTTVRTVRDCALAERTGDGLCRLLTLEITGSGFLYNMVRIVAGTALYVGLGKIAAADLPGIIARGRRQEAGKTLPPQGLTLLRIGY